MLLSFELLLRLIPCLPLSLFPLFYLPFPPSFQIVGSFWVGFLSTLLQLLKNYSFYIRQKLPNKSQLNPSEFSTSFLDQLNSSQIQKYITLES